MWDRLGSGMENPVEYGAALWLLLRPNFVFRRYHVKPVLH